MFPITLRRTLALAALGGLLAGAVALPGAAHARVWVGFGFPLVVGPPAYYPPPPVYYPPPAYYPPYPPPAPYYAPPPQTYVPPPAHYTPSPSAQSCYAGTTVCPMERPIASGASCYCTTANGGRVWGHAS